MAKREVAFSGFSGLLAFGAGVAVGANWPRASNFVGFILQRLGFELTDLALWMWDPEKSLAQEAESAPVKRAKKAQSLVLQDGIPNAKRVGAKAKMKKTVFPANNPSGEGVRRATRSKTKNGHQSWIRSEGLSGSSDRGNGNYPSIQSGKAGSLGRRRTPQAANVSSTQPERMAIPPAGKKAKRTTIKAGRKTSSGRRGGRKMRSFPDMVLPAEAALN